MKKLINCYDSHVHWHGTGALPMRLRLHDLECASDVLQLQIDPHHYRGDWLVGFGWDNNRWSKQDGLDRQTLDQLWPDTPVAFGRTDGHAKWVNTAALKQAGLWPESPGEVLPVIEGGIIDVDASGLPTGLLIDRAMNAVEECIPDESDRDVRSGLLNAVKIFNRAGFTHIRDMTCSEQQWNVATSLDQNHKLTLAVIQMFNADGLNNFDEVLRLAKRARREQTPNLRAEGIKIYLDGALGSEGAWLSQDYLSGSGRGLRLMSDNELDEIIRRSWAEEFSVAIHAIGDEAAHQVALAAHRVSDSGCSGRLHLEHAEMMRPETILLLTKLDVICFMQPCHWLSDRTWAEQKLGELTKYLFPWRSLEESGVPFFFGSDAPIETASIANNLEALISAKSFGIENISGDPYSRHSYPDKIWTPDTYSEFENGQTKQVVFRGKPLTEGLY